MDHRKDEAYRCILKLRKNNRSELEAKRDNNSLQEDLHDNWNRGSEVDAAADEKTDLKGRIHEVEKLAEKISQDRLGLNEDIVKRTCDRACTLSRLESLKDCEMGLGSLLSAAREKMNILQLFLLHFAEKAYQGKPMKPFLPAEEIAKHKMNFRMGHGTNSLVEEKQLLKQMNVRPKEGVDSFSSLEGHCYTPPYVDTWHLHLDEFYYVKNQRSIVRNRLRQIQELKWKSARPGILFQRQWDEPNGYVGDNANAAANAIANPKRRIWDSLSLKKALQEQIKVSGQKVDEVTKSLLAVRPKIKKVERELTAIERDIECLKKKLTLMDQRKDEAQTNVSSTMEELEANSTQTAPVLESEGDKENLYENRNQGSQVDGLINDAADEEPNLKGRIQEAEKLAAKISQEKLELIEDIAQRTKMNFRMGHGTNSLEEENKLLKEMNARQKEGAGLFPSLEGDCYTPRDVDVRLLPLNECMYEMNQRSIIQHRLRQIEEIKWQSARPGILFQSQWGEPVGHASDTANAAANAVANPKGRIWDSLRSKKALQEQIKISREKVDELTKSLLTFRHGPIFKEVESELKVIERDIESTRKANTTEKLEDNSTQIPPVLESEGDDIRLQESLYESRNQCPEGDEEPNLKARIEEAEKLVANTSRDILELIRNISRRKYDLYCACSLLDYYRNRHKAGIRDCLNLEREKMNILQLFLLRCANKSHPGLSVEGIAKHKLSFRMVHGTNNLAEEKRLLKEINVSEEVSAGSLSSLENDYHMLPENTWWSDHQSRYVLNQRKIVHYRLRQIQELKSISNAKANANVAAAAIFKGKIWDALRSKKSLREQIRETGTEIDELKKLLFAPVRPEIKWVEKELKVIEEDIECLLKKLPLMDQREREAYGLHKLRKQQNLPLITARK
ncbi:unnamed protein product [Malus baccata var. baccata]